MTPTGFRKYPAWTALLTLTFVWVMFFAKPVFTRSVRLQWDALDLHYPHLVHVSRSIQSGTIPFWEPYLFCGYPLVGYLQAGTYYPIHFMIALLREISPVIVIHLITIHYLIAILSAFWLARVLKLALPAAVMSGMAYGMSGQLLGHATHLGILEQLAVLPLILAIVILGVQKTDWRYGIMAGTASGFGILAGHFQSGMYCFTLLLVWTFWESLFQPDQRTTIRRIGTALLWVGVITVMTMLVSGIQLFTTAELAHQSSRSSISYHLSTSESLTAKSLVTAFFPDAFGGIRGPYWGAWDRTNQQCYIGLISLIFLGFFGAGPKTRRDWFLTGLAGFGLLFALGDKTPVHPVALHIVPGWNLVRTPAAMLPISVLALAMMVGRGIEMMREMPWEKATRILFSSALGISGMGLGSMGLLVRLGIRQDSPWNLQEWLLQGMEWGAILFLIFGTLSVVNRYRTAYPMVMWILPFVFWVELMIVYRSSDLQFAHGDPYQDFQQTPVRAFLDEAVSKNPEIRVHEWDIRSVLLTNEGSLRHYPTTSGRISGLHPRWIGELVRMVEFRKQILDLLRVKYVLVGRPADGLMVQSTAPLNADWPKWKPRQELFRVSEFILENPEVFPHVFRVSDWVISDAKETTLNLLTQIDLRTTAILDSEPGIEPGPDPSGAITVLRQDDCHLDFTGHFGRDSLVIIGDVFYPGWRVWIDGTEGWMMRADHALRGIIVPAGFHHIEMEFIPGAFRPGVFCTLTGLMITIIVLCLKRRSVDYQGNVVP